MACDTGLPAFLVVCSGRTLVQHGETRPALDRNRRWSMAPFAGALAGLGLGLCVMGWRGQSRFIPRPEFWTGSGRISASTSRWNAVGAVIYLRHGRLTTIDRRVPVQNGQGMAKFLTGLDGILDRALTDLTAGP